MAKYTLDRFEGEVAVLLLRSDETIEKHFLRGYLPNNAVEGDILDISLYEDGRLKYAAVLEKDTEDARKQAERLIEKLKNKNR